MVHKYVETTPETVMSQLQMLGHANVHGQNVLVLDSLLTSYHPRSYLMNPEKERKIHSNIIIREHP